MAKDQTVIGITGKPVPKPRTAKQQYELEKKRREEKHLGKNVGGVQYRSDVTPYYNPRARTYKEFVEIAEAQRLAHKFPLSKDELATVQRIRDRLNDKSSPESLKQVSPTRSASRKVRRIDFVDRSNVKIKEESDVAEKPVTPEEKRKIRKMQQLERLTRMAKASKYQSDVAREEFEIDEANRMEREYNTPNWDKVYDRNKRDYGDNQTVTHRGRTKSGALETPNQTTKRLGKERVQAHKDTRGMKKKRGEKEDVVDRMIRRMALEKRAKQRK